jgi:hypothetical protein
MEMLRLFRKRKQDNNKEDTKGELYQVLKSKFTSCRLRVLKTKRTHQLEMY